MNRLDDLVSRRRAPTYRVTALLICILLGSLLGWAAFAKLDEVSVAMGPEGEEIFVVEGDLTDEHGSYETGTWVRYPVGSNHAPSSKNGCILYVKTGHLPVGKGA